MSYNTIIGEVETVVPPSVEPVTLPEVKRHLNLLFLNQTEETYNFSDDDGYLTDLIPQCRESLEIYCGISMTERTLRVTVQNNRGSIELPYGPVKEVTGVTDYDGGDVEYKTRGGILISPCEATVTYTAGYEVVPPGLKRALLEEIAWRYNHRGDEVDISEPTKKYAKRYRRITWLG